MIHWKCLAKVIARGLAFVVGTLLVFGVIGGALYMLGRLCGENTPAVLIALAAVGVLASVVFLEGRDAYRRCVQECGDPDVD